MSDSPEYNATGIDYTDRRHFTYEGPILDFHAHVMVTRPGDPTIGPPLTEGPGASTDQADTMLRIGSEFGVYQTVTMCPLNDVEALRERFGDQLVFNAMVHGTKPNTPEEETLRLLDTFLEKGAKLIKFWSAPRGRDRGLLVDTPWRIEAARRARGAGVRLIMVHVGDPDYWFRTMYADSSKFGTKADQYVGLRRMIEMFPDMLWIGAHMGGDSEHPDHLQALLEAYPNLYFDTSATKWQIREVSPRRLEIRDLILRFPDRFLFGTDLVTRHHLTPEHYTSRYWCQRTLWESTWEGPSPISDADYQPQTGEPPTPMLRGLGLPRDVLEMVYFRNAERLLNLPVI